MVAMGSSLADRAWTRESAVFRITGVISVIGGWFITAGVAFIVCFLVTNIMFFGSYVAMVVAVIIAVIVYLSAFSLVIKLWLGGKKKSTQTATAEVKSGTAKEGKK